MGLGDRPYFASAAPEIAAQLCIRLDSQHCLQAFSFDFNPIFHLQTAYQTTILSIFMH